MVEDEGDRLFARPHDEKDGAVRIMLETTIIGNIGSMRLAAAGETQVLNVSIAASRKLGDREFTDWVSAKIWGGVPPSSSPICTKAER